MDSTIFFFHMCWIMINLLDNLICSLKNRALDVEILNPVTMLLTRDEISPDFCVGHELVL